MPTTELNLDNLTGPVEDQVVWHTPFTGSDPENGSVTGPIDWETVTPEEMYDLSVKMMDAAKIPAGVRTEHFDYFFNYIFSL